MSTNDSTTPPTTTPSLQPPSQLTTIHQKKKTKLVVRRIPLHIQESLIKQLLSPFAHQYNYYYWTTSPTINSAVRKCKKKYNRFYINFLDYKHVISFVNTFQALQFPLSANASSEKTHVLVEFAPYQKIPALTNKKMDRRTNTIEKDTDFIAFVDFLKNRTKKVIKIQTKIENNKILEKKLLRSLSADKKKMELKQKEIIAPLAQHLADMNTNEMRNNYNFYGGRRKNRKLSRAEKRALKRNKQRIPLENISEISTIDVEKHVQTKSGKYSWSKKKEKTSNISSLLADMQVINDDDQSHVRSEFEERNRNRIRNEIKRERVKNRIRDQIRDRKKRNRRRSPPKEDRSNDMYDEWDGEYDHRYGSGSGHRGNRAYDESNVNDKEVFYRAPQKGKSNRGGVGGWKVK